MTTQGREHLLKLAREALPLDKLQRAAAEEGINELDDGEARQMAAGLEHALGRLPTAIADVDAALNRHGASKSVDASAAAGRSILVVDDDNVFAGRLVKMLVEMGYDARHLETMEDAALKPSPFMVLADVTMPHLDGYQLLAQIKSVAPTAATVAMTVARDDALEAVATRCNRIGARYLTKLRGSTALSLQLQTLVAAAKSEI